MFFSYSIFFLGLAVSIDNFSTGIAYGLRSIQISWKSSFIIGFCSALTLFMGTLFGMASTHLLSGNFTTRLGGIILIGIGIVTLYNFYKKDSSLQPCVMDKPIFHWEIKSIGVVIEIMRKPDAADFDQSGSINGLEAFFLGIALSLDAFGVGISAAMMHVSILPLMSIVFIMSAFFLKLGMVTGSSLSKYRLLQNISFLPGIVLVLIGLLKII
ncbi:MAG: ytaF [Bacillales bacterium]|nr:ytaF [Bacillales bacterium]